MKIHFANVTHFEWICGGKVGGKRIMAVIRTMLGFNKGHDLRNSGLQKKKKDKKKDRPLSEGPISLIRCGELPPLLDSRGMRSLKSS